MLFRSDKKTAEKASIILIDKKADNDDGMMDKELEAAAIGNKIILSHCIAKEIMDRGFTCVYMTAFQLFDTLAKHTFGKGKDSFTGNR